jgi:hypothetical protein
MNSNIARQSQQISQMNNSLSRGFSGLAKSVSGLSSAVARGAASTVAAVGRGAGGAVGSAAAGAGRVSASAVSGITGGIVSALSYALPTAIAGVIGKSLIWDNIDEDTKKEMGENIGGIFKNVFGDSLKPVTKELKVMTLTLADTLESLSDRIGSVVSGIKGKLPALKDGARETASNVSNAASNVVDSVKDKIPRGARVASIMASDVSGVAKKGVELARSASGVDTGEVKQGVAAVGVGAVGVSVTKTLQGASATAKGVEKAAGAKNSISKLAMDLLKKDGSKITKASLLAARVVARLTLMSGPTVAKLLGMILKYKLAKYTAVLSVVIEGGMYWVITSEIEAMMQEGVLTAEEGKALIELARKQSLYSGAGALALGGIGAAAGSGLLSIPLGIAGSVAGGMAGSKIAEMTTKLPDSLKEEYDESKAEKKMGDSVGALDVANKRDKKKQKTSAATVSKPSAGATESKGEKGNAQKAMEFFMSKGWTREQAAGIVGNLQTESSTFSTVETGDGGKAVGIAQWHPDRQARFKEIFKKDIREATFEEQLAFVDYELNNQEKVAGNKLREAKSAEEAALVIDEYYERSKGTGKGKGGDAIKKRQQYALALVGGSAQTTMMAGGGGDQTAGLKSDQVSAAQKPTAGMNISQKMDYYRGQLGEDGAQASSTPKPNEQKKPGMFDSFKNAFSSDAFDKLTGDLQKGVEDLMSFDITSKKEAAASASAPPVSGGDTVVNVSGGGGNSPPAYNPIAPAASYQSQFTSLAGIQRTA